MTVFKICILTLFLFNSSLTWSQTSLVDKLSKLEIEQKSLTSYHDKNGNTIGCDLNLECQDFSTIFYSVIVDKRKGVVKLQGRTYLSYAKHIDSLTKLKFGDTVGSFSVNIFLAKPLKQTLIEIPGMSFSSHDFDNIGFAKFPYRTGDFNITLKVRENQRLYLVGYNHHLKEYDIGKLMR